MNWKKAAKPLIGVGVGGAVLVWGAGVALAGPGAPTALTITRNPEDGASVTVSWAPVEGATRYNVKVVDDAAEKVSVVSGDTTSFAISNIDGCKRLKVSVSSRDDSGKGASSKTEWIDTAAPGLVTNLKATRSADGNQVTMTWDPPANTGAAEIYEYQTYGNNYLQRVPGTARSITYSVAHLQNKDFSGSVTALNHYGSCKWAPVENKVSGKTLQSFKVTRDPGDPRKVLLSWGKPGKALSRYSVRAYFDKATSAWTYIPAEATSFTYTIPAELPAEKAVEITFVPNFADGTNGTWETWKLPSLDEGTIKPKVVVEHQWSRLFTRLDIAAGDYAAYPSVFMRAVTAEGYRNEEWMVPGSKTLAMHDLPKGVYTVTVGGANELGEEEWSRQTVAIGGDEVFTMGAFNAYADEVKWKDGSSTYVEMTTQPVGSQDLTVGFTPTADFAVALRANPTPSYADRFNGLVLRSEANHVETVNGQQIAARGFSLVKVFENNECGKQLAGAFAPAGVTATSRIVVSVVGNTLTATADGKVVLAVSDLAAANRANCGGSMPTGDRFGFRSNWDQPIDDYTNVTFRTGA
ncbi:hypothetical protein Val02_49000 [Virgisporangium aliadipatigenens]|uniref:Fibronectin type-III domain-containing protein n=1 Tax=Virgisporangium aliadipatigenens TaxID=741659 RepID=A0A8J3YM36_9ACTN|nr:fibronectin type III domain-containing protein [Virgisporangium aliadipatigenens]GIJ48014.1 hypothetical protein Val02_49000 [Virgisporangium aliadipatigenens]